MNSNKHSKVQVVIIYLADKDSTSNAQVLLLQMNEERGAHWQSVTGSVDPGESYEKAAKRELFEETGIDSKVSEIDLSFEFHDRWNKNVLEKVYFTTILSKPKIAISNEEHQSFKWVDIKEIVQESFGYPSNYQAFLKVLEVLK